MQKAFTLYKEHFKITQAPFPNVWRRAAFGNLGNIKKVVETPDSNLRGWKQAFTLCKEWKKNVILKSFCSGSHPCKKAAEALSSNPSGRQTVRAFTLIELLVVVLIIGILSAIALPQYQKAIDKARAVEALTLIGTVRQSVQEYILMNQTFPNSFDELSVVPTGPASNWSVEHNQIKGKYHTCVLVAGRIDCGNEIGGGFVWLWDSSYFYTPLGGEKRLWCYVVESESYQSTRQRAHNICKSISGKSTGISYAGDVFYAVD